mgnify:CR=1 FL=1
MKVNKNYQNIAQSYLFSTIAKKVNEYAAANPDKKIIRLGIGDVTLPLCECVVEALKKASDEMGVKETFKGYGPEQGYEFVKTAVQEYYKTHGVELENDEIFISDGAKSDLGNILDLFDKDNTVLVPDPVYPVYVDTNTMNGRKIVYINANADNEFLPLPDESIKADIIYICSPNNPTGSAMTKESLQKWVDWANEHHSVILFDAAYEAYISDENVPHSIYECAGARTCAIEIRSFSKNAGFTGVRLGYTVVPHDLKDAEGKEFYPLWARRHGTKFNGAPYIQQRAGEAVFKEEGQKEVKALVAYYMENAKIIREGLKNAGYTVYGGVNAPYIWLKTPDGMTSWEFFDYLLNKANVVGTPGSGFGPSGEGYFRLTSFGSKENTKEAMERFKKLFK